MAHLLPKRPPPGPLGATNPLNWRLDSSDAGRHVWHYARGEEAEGFEQVWGEDERGVREDEQSVEAKYWLGLQLPVVHGLTSPRGNPYEAAKKGPWSCAGGGREAYPQLGRIRILQATTSTRWSLEWRVWRAIVYVAASFSSDGS